MGMISCPHAALSSKFLEYNMEPAQNGVAKYYNSLQLGPYHLFNPGGAPAL